MKTYEEMRDRYIAQRDARETAISVVVDAVRNAWIAAFEERMETLFKGERPAYAVSIYSNQFCNSTEQARSEYLDEATARAAQEVVDHFVEAGFSARKIVCASAVGVEVSWDPDDN